MKTNPSPSLHDPSLFRERYHLVDSSLVTGLPSPDLNVLPSTSAL